MGGSLSSPQPGAAEPISLGFTAPEADLQLASTRGEQLWLAEH